MPLLEVKDLKVYYPVRGGWFRPRRFVRAVDGVSFTVNAGETVGLVGESGCGKSTLGKALVRLLTPESGSVRLNGIDIGALKGRELRRQRRNLQMIFQDPYGSLNPRLTVFSALDEVLALHFPMTKEARRERAGELLEQVGLGVEALDRYPHEFSGGQRQRIGIARALAAQPAFIVADEPVSALDVSVQAAIINLLDDIRRETGTAFLFVAHDLAVVEHISSRILVMYLGRVVESAPSRELVRHPFHPYTKALLSAVPTVDGAGKARILLPGDVPSPLDPPDGCPFHPRCPKACERCRREVPPLVAPDGSERLCACFYPETSV